MLSEWPACYAATRKYEGGNDDDPRDPGGRTSRGILQREWTPYVHSHPGLPVDVWQAPESAITDIYKNDYWDKVDGDDWPAGCDMTVWDAGVNSGVARSMQWAASVLGATGSWRLLASKATALADKTTFIHAFNAKRLGFLHGLRTFATFGHGWTVRVASVEALSCKMALAASGLPSEAQTSTLQKKANDAKDKANKHAGGVAGSVTAGGASVTYSHDPIIVGVLVAVVVAVAAYSIWHWYVNNTRATAMEVAAHG